VCARSPRSQAARTASFRPPKEDGDLRYVEWSGAVFRSNHKGPALLRKFQGPGSCFFAFWRCLDPILGKDSI